MAVERNKPYIYLQYYMDGATRMNKVNWYLKTKGTNHDDTVTEFYNGISAPPPAGYASGTRVYRVNVDSTGVTASFTETVDGSLTNTENAAITRVRVEIWDQDRNIVLGHSTGNYSDAELTGSGGGGR